MNANGCYTSIISFGDSLADTGNLKQIYATSKRDPPHFFFPPYGETFFHKVTGRCSDDRLIIDFIAETLGMLRVSPYEIMKTSNVMEIGQGINFAVVGATALDSSFYQAKGVYNPFTNASLSIQLKWFKELLLSICATESANEPTFFSLKIFHGGEFVNFSGRKYVRGKISYVDMVDYDEFSVHEIDEIMRRLSYAEDEVMYYHYKVPGKDLDIGLRALGSDQDLLSMLQHVHIFKLIDIYIEHGSTKVNTYSQAYGSSVVIQELDDVGPSNSSRFLQLGWHPIQAEQEVIDHDASDGINEDEQDGNDIEQDAEQEGNDIEQEAEFYVPYIEEMHDSFDQGAEFDVHAQGVVGDDIFLSEIFNDTQDQFVSHDQSDNANLVEDDSEDSDYIVDEDYLVEDVDVDMEEFKASVDMEEDDVLVDDDNVDESVEMDLDDFESASGSDNEVPLKKRLANLKKKKKQWKPDVPSPFYIGQTIGDKKEIQRTVTQNAVESRRQLVVCKNDNLRFRVVCYGTNPNLVCSEKGESSKVGGSSVGGPSVGSSVGGTSGSSKALKKKRFPKPTCPWTLHISRAKIEHLWCVKTFKEEHRCLQTREVRLYTVSAVARELEPIVEANPGIPLKALQDILQRKHQVQISFQKIFRAKHMAVKKLHGDYTAQYGLLRDYCDELLRSNPGSTVKIEVETECNPAAETRQFKRIYICFAAMKRGFKACGRDLIGLDGCFMKGPYPGQILTVVGVDSNNGIYPVAYAIVEAETTSSWTWFLNCLGEDLDLYVNSNFTFISDRQKGIIPALSKVFPAAEHRFCLRHIHENMKSKWRGHMYKDLLWKCATATTMPHFNRCMETVRTRDEGMHQWLKQIPAKHWSRSHFTGIAKCDILLNNLCEVFNRQLVGGRDKPIITCLEYIREYMMRRIVVVHKLISKCEGPLTPAATKAFSAIKNQAAEYTVIMCGVKKISGYWTLDGSGSC